MQRPKPLHDRRQLLRGSCSPTGVLSCDDQNLCTDDICDPTSGCIFTANTVDCDDQNLCTAGDQCQGGSCISGPTLFCDDDVFCNGLETCDPMTGCVSGSPPKVDDGIACTVDACDQELDAPVHVPVDSLCDDGQFCNGVESCDAEIGCVLGQTPQIDDGIACTVDLCEEVSDAILPTWLTTPPVTTERCCNGAEVCNTDIGCEAGAPPLLDDGLDCTIDACDEAFDTVTHTDDDLCPADGPCTIGRCVPVTGCDVEVILSCCGNGITESGEACDDGNDTFGDGCTGCQLPQVQVEEFNATGVPATFVVPQNTVSIESVTLIGPGGGGGGVDTETVVQEAKAL